jgi:3-methyladenine DNA glycosylase AlkD
LLSWPASKNRWKKRAAIVSLVPLAKHGLFKKEILQIAEKLLADSSDDLVNKANGWTLREFGKYSQPALISFLKKHRGQIPRVTMRYALERTSKSLANGL